MIPELEALKPYIKDTAPPFFLELLQNAIKTIATQASGRDLQMLDVPNEGDTVNVNCTSGETVIMFSGIILNPFTLNITIPETLIPGDRLFLIFTGSEETNDVLINFIGSINSILCSGQENSWHTKAYTNVIPLIFDGNLFTGIDNC